MTLDAYQSGRIKQAAEDGNREFITLHACISAAGTKIAPALLYKGTSRDMQDTWLDELKEGDKAYFGTSENGWSNKEYGIVWLRQVFDRETRALAGHRRRLLIVDGHLSHVNLEFLEACDRLRILVLILPPYSTHRL